MATFWRALISIWLCAAGLALHAQGVVRLTSGEWPPYLSESLPNYGIASRIVVEAFATQGVAVRFGFFPWPRAYKMAIKDWDGSVLWLKNAQRTQDFYFSDPVIDAHYVLFRLKATPLHWQSVEDLADLRLGVTNGYFYGAAFQSAIDSGVLKVDTAPSELINMRKLLAGRIDAFPMMTQAGLYMLKTQFSEDEAARVTFDPQQIHVQSLYLMLSKGDPAHRALMDKFNAGLKQLRASGKYDEYLGGIVGLLGDPAASSQLAEGRSRP